MLFYLGTHEPGWLKRLKVPLFVSRRRLARLANLPTAVCRWGLDSGGFSELSLFGEWQTPPARYVAEVRRYRLEVGKMDWAAIQDWMCEPFMLNRTGKTVEQHQRLTISSLLTLQDAGPEIPWLPVVQGFAFADYMRHVEMYQRAGVDLRTFPVVGIGSVCRRQATREAAAIVQELAAAGIRLHGFGVKTTGLKAMKETLYSADSMAWSFNARKNPPLPGHVHASCANCSAYALMWRENMLLELVNGVPVQSLMSFIDRAERAPLS